MSGTERRAQSAEMLAAVVTGICSPAAAVKARKRDHSGLQRVRAANAADDPDWLPDALETRVSAIGKKGSKVSKVTKASPPPIGSVRLSAAEARVQMASGQNGRATFSAKLKWRRSKLVYDLVPVGGPSVTGGPERRFYPAGSGGDEAFANDMRGFSDKNLGNSTCQVRHRLFVLCFEVEIRAACVLLAVHRFGKW